jgi:hypothetical protein
MELVGSCKEVDLGGLQVCSLYTRDDAICVTRSPDDIDLEVLEGWWRSRLREPVERSSSAVRNHIDDKRLRGVMFLWASNDEIVPGVCIQYMLTYCAVQIRTVIGGGCLRHHVLVRCYLSPAGTSFCQPICYI